MSIEVLWQKKGLVVINKPAGVDVAEIRKWWKNRWRGLDGDRNGLVHRLDKETTGCLILAEDDTSMKIMMDNFRERKVMKKYVGVVHGRLMPREGKIVLPIRRSRRDRKKQEVGYDGKEAVTSWWVAKTGLIGGEEYSLVNLYPKTGRMHQIRVHMAHYKHPLLSDQKYLAAKQYKKDLEICKHHFLHAKSVEFIWMGEREVIEAPFDETENAVLKMLE